MRNPRDINRLLERILEDEFKKPRDYVPRASFAGFCNQVEAQVRLRLDQGEVLLALFEEVVTNEAELVEGAHRASYRRTLDDAVSWVALSTGQLLGAIASEIEVSYHEVLNLEWDWKVDSLNDFTRRWVRCHLAPRRFRDAANQFARFGVSLPEQAPLGAEWSAYDMEWQKNTESQCRLLLHAIHKPVTSRSVVSPASAKQVPVNRLGRAGRLRLEFAIRTLVCYGRLGSK
jgi:hypothetical protein